MDPFLRRSVTPSTQSSIHLPIPSSSLQSIHRLHRIRVFEDSSIQTTINTDMFNHPAIHSSFQSSTLLFTLHQPYTHPLVSRSVHLSIRLFISSALFIYRSMLKFHPIISPSCFNSPFYPFISKDPNLSNIWPSKRQLTFFLITLMYHRPHLKGQRSRQSFHFISILLFLMQHSLPMCPNRKFPESSGPLRGRGSDVCDATLTSESPSFCSGLSYLKIPTLIGRQIDGNEHLCL